MPSESIQGLTTNILFPAETNTFKSKYWNNISNIEHGEWSEAIYWTLMSYCLLFCDVIKNSEGNTVIWKVYTLGAFILEYGV